MKVRPSALIIENNHVLLLRYNYGGHDVLALPGGNPDRGETLIQTIERELFEELQITTEVSDLIFMGEVLLPEVKNDVLHCVFIAKIIGGIPVLNPKETTALEIVWKNIMTLHQHNLYPNVSDAIQDLMLTGSVAPYLGKIQQQYFG